MVRIFNIYFTHDDVLYSAIVSVRTTPFFTEYVLGNLDFELRDLLPGVKIISQNAGEFFFQNQPQHSTLLMKEIIKSIVNHLHAGNDLQLKSE